MLPPPQPSDNLGRVLCVRRFDLHAVPRATGTILPSEYHAICLRTGSDTLLQVFLTQAIGMGIGQGMLFLPALTIIGHHFKRKRALATGIVVTGASAGGIGFPILLDFLANRVSFTFAIRISAAVVAVLLIVVNMSVSMPQQQEDTPKTGSGHLIRRTLHGFHPRVGFFFPIVFV
jgi:MFS family permease